jgi:hypothetical protein
VSVALAIRHAKRKRRIALSCVAFPTLPQIFTLSHKWHDFGEKVIQHKNVYFEFLYNFRVKNLSFKEEFSEVLS